MWVIAQILLSPVITSLRIVVVALGNAISVDERKWARVTETTLKKWVECFASEAEACCSGIVVEESDDSADNLVREVDDVARILLGH
jgi:hypothetical protein